VVERAVILSETDTFVVDESWLQSESPSPPTLGLSALDDREVEMIEARSCRNTWADIRTYRRGRETWNTTSDVGIEDPTAGYRQVRVEATHRLDTVTS
jgi:hypothetical protein